MSKRITKTTKPTKSIKNNIAEEKDDVLSSEKGEGGIYEEYFRLTNKYKNEYGNNTVVLMQVGAFFEIYGLVKKPDGGDNTTSSVSDSYTNDSEIDKITKICNLNIAEKKITYKNQQVVMAGVRDYSLDKYLQILTENGITAVVFVQEKNEKNTRRIFDSVHSSGTYMSYDIETSPKITNNIMCIWLNVFKRSVGGGGGGGGTLTGGTIHNQTLVCGVSVVDNFTGKSSIFEYSTPYYKNPTTFDELERQISISQPSEVILVSPFNDDEINNIIQFIGLRTKTFHKINLTTNEKAVNCEKQKYISHILSTFYGDETFQLCEEFNTNIIATQSFCFLLNFIQEHSKDLTRKISLPTFNNSSGRVALANHTLKQLNIIPDATLMEEGVHLENNQMSSVLSFLNKCCSPMGRRGFQYQLLHPTSNIEWLETEYKMTDIMLSEWSLVSPLRKIITQIKDIEKVCRQIVVRKIYPNSIYNLCTSIENIEHCYFSVAEGTTNGDNGKHIIEYCCNRTLHPNKELDVVPPPKTKEIIQFIQEKLIINNCKGIQTVQLFDKPIICHGISPLLDEYYQKQKEHTETLENIQTLFNDTLRNAENPSYSGEKTAVEYVKIHETEKSGLSFQITKKRATILKGCLSKITSGVLQIPSFSSSGNNIQIQIKDIKISSASTSNDEIEFPLLNKICRELHSLKDKINKEIQNVYGQFIEELEQKWLQTIEGLASFIATLDVLLTKAYIANQYNYCRPVIHRCGDTDETTNETTDDDNCVSFVNAKGLRHCLIEHIKQNETYVSNDISIGGNASPSGLLIYGINTSGKTSLIRSVGISVILAQSGMFVPCSHFEYYPYTAIFSRILGNDNLFKGLSTFAVEMSELRTILKMSDNRSLIIGDELCSGTETESAISIFISGIMELYKKNASFLFATHLHEIVGFDEIHAMADKIHIKHLSIHYDQANDCIVYDRTLRDGSGPSNYGLMVCRSLFLPDDFLENAHKIREKYFPETKGILSHNVSRYNARKIIGFCELCKVKLGKDTHHLQEQKYADERGYILGREGEIHKNHNGNLAVLCGECHNKVHNPKTEIKLTRKKTSKGYAIIADTVG